MQWFHWIGIVIACGGPSMLALMALEGHTRNDRRHVNNGMSKSEIHAELRAVNVKIDLIHEAIREIRTDLRVLLNNGKQ